jgi:hypothetical protein
MLDLLLMLTAGDPSATEAAGRLDYVVTRCAAFGWAADEAERSARVEALMADQPDRSREEVIREFALGTRYAFSREGETIQIDKSSEDRVRWARDTERLCDKIANDHPRLLRRTPETARRWATLLATENL